MFSLWDKSVETKLREFLIEDGLERMSFASMQHPDELVTTQIKWKSNLLVAGMPLVYKLLELFIKNEKCHLPTVRNILAEMEGHWVKSGEVTELQLPFSSFIFFPKTKFNEARAKDFSYLASINKASFFLKFASC